VGRRYDTISVLSDFGHVDGFAGQVTAVIRDLAPHVTVLDLSHDVPPFDVRAGSLTLARCVPYLPEGVVLAAVDPDVGTGRPPVAIEVADGAGVLVGPDNGLLAPAVAMAGGAQRAVALTDPDYHLARVGRTATGRDVLAPVAAHLCNGVDLAELGELVEPGLLLPGVVPLPRYEGDTLVCEVLWVDHYGNCQLNIGPAELADQWQLALGDVVRVELLDLTGGRRIRAAVLADTFAGLGPGEIGLIEDGYGMLALCCDRASAAAELQVASGDQVVLSLPAEHESHARPPVSTPVQLRPTR
jgi:S-adenosylmethionine hydrolase